MKEKITKFIQSFSAHNRIKDNLETIDFRKLKITYIAKGSQDSAVDAAMFGSDVERYKFWRPHICAVYCLKMAGDASNKTNDMTPSMLLDECIAEGVFLVDKE